MESTLLSSCTRFGKFVPNEHKNNPNLSSVVIQQSYSHPKPFVSCKFSPSGDKIYLLDSIGDLISLSLADNGLSTFGGHKILDFIANGKIY